MTDTRWLTTDEQLTWRLYMETTRLLFDALDRQLQADAGLSLADYEILVRLSEAPGHRLRMSDLAAATLYSRSRLSHAVSRLESAGWVRREECPQDKRGLFAVLTAGGYDKLAAAAIGHVTAVRHLLVDQLGANQMRQLTGICSALRENLDDTRRGGAAPAGAAAAGAAGAAGGSGEGGATEAGAGDGAPTAC